jgi:hypothetical protein
MLDVRTCLEPWLRILHLVGGQQLPRSRELDEWLAE